jgi:hypothetical protein
MCWSSNYNMNTLQYHHLDSFHQHTVITKHDVRKLMVSVCCHRSVITRMYDEVTYGCPNQVPLAIMIYIFRIFTISTMRMMLVTVSIRWGTTFYVPSKVTPSLLISIVICSDVTSFCARLRAAAAAATGTTAGIIRNSSSHEKGKNPCKSHDYRANYDNSVISSKEIVFVFKRKQS